VEIEIAKHAKLKGRVNSPSRLGFGYGDGVDEVEHEFHGKKGDEEPYAVKNCSIDGYTWRSISELGDIIIKSNDRSSQV